MSSSRLPTLKQFREALNETAIVAVTDQSGKIIDCNKKFCEISGFSKKELIGQNHRLINSGLHGKSFFQEMYKTISSGEIWKGTIRNKRKDGSLYWVDTTIIPTKNNRGNINSYIAVRFEVTEHVAALKELESAADKIRQAAEAKDQFLANMSHEVRTPLNGIMGLAAALVNKSANPPNREMAELILKSGESLRKILDDVLDLAKLEAGQMTIDSRHFNIREEIYEITEIMRPQAEEKGISFVVDFHSSSEKIIEGDPLRVRQILSNLVSNAIKFTTNGYVHVRVSINQDTDQSALSISVEDTGIGFDESFAANLFDRFMQADGTIARRYGGTGLGLAISKSLANMMHGTLTAQSEPGKGSTFLLAVPIKVVATTETTAQPESSLDEVSESLRILVAEDHPTNQLVIQHLLEPLGADVTIVNNGEEALATVAIEDFDIILMDIQMPIMDGITATCAIRKREENLGLRRMPIAMLTANTSEAHRQTAHKSGADGFIAKPITMEVLVNGINEVLRSSRDCAQHEILQVVT